MTRQDQVQLRMEIDGKQAISEIGKLENEAYEFRQEMKLAKEDVAAFEKESKNLEKSQKRVQELTAKLQKMTEEGKQNTKAFRDTNAQLSIAKGEYDKASIAAEKLNASKTQVKELEKSLDGVNDKLRDQRKEAGLTGMTMRQLVSHKRDLIRQQSQLSVGTEQWRKMGTQIQEVDSHIMSAKRNVEASKTAWAGLGTSLKHFSVLAIGIMGAQGIIGSMRAFITGASEFEQAMSDMSAITGSTGEDLDFYSQKARELGAATTLSAQQAAEAFTIIGSKKPELLENRDALVETTRAAITLAEAAGITLPEAADALTNTLNQFGVGADQAQKYINILAAGSKFGAGEIDFLNESVKKFGPAAAEMNISFEQSVAMMEVFAEKGLTAEESGTNFRNILLKMAAAGDDTNPAIVGMAGAIENLGKKQLDVTELTKMFGVENVIAAQIMLSSADRFVELTAKVTGTSAAVEMARTRVANFKGDVKQLSNITGDYVIVIGSWITDGLRPVIQGLTQMLVLLKSTPQFLKENKDLILALGVALVTFNSAQIVSTALKIKDNAITAYKIVLEKAAILSTISLTTVQKALNAAYTANPIGFVIKAVALLAAGFVVLYNRSETVRGAIAGIGQVAVTLWDIIKETFGNFSQAFTAFKDGDISKGLKLLGTSIVKANPIALAVTEGKRLADAFKKGYSDKIAEGGAVDGITLPDGSLSTDSPENPVNPIVPGETEEEKAAREKAEKDAQAKLKAHLEKLEEQWKSYREKIVSLQREYALKEMPEQDAAIEKNRQTYRVLEEELVKFWEEKIITTGEFELRLQENTKLRLQEEDRIRLEFRAKYEESEKAYDEKALEEKKKAQQEFFEVTSSSEEVQIAQINAFYDRMIQLARKYGWNIAALETQRAADIAAIQKANADKAYSDEIQRIRDKMEIYQDFGQGAIGIMEGIAEFQGESNKFAKETAIFKALIASGEAIATMVAAFTVGTFSPIQLAAKVAAGIGIIITNIATANRTINSANEPDVPSAESKPNTGRSRPPKPKKSFYFGGETGEGMGFGDEYGEYAGYVHRHEYVIPQAVRQEPIVKMQIEPMLEALRMKSMSGRSFYNGGDTGSTPINSPAGGSPGMGSDPEIKQLLRNIDAGIKSMKNKKVILVNSELEDFQSEKVELANRYSVP